MGNSISPHIENAQKTGVCSLKNRGLVEIPQPLLRLGATLRTLDLSDNKLKVLPSAIGNLTGLKNMTLSSNRLETLPSDLGKLKKLEVLMLNNNNLKVLPVGLFTNLTHLKTVSLASNQITAFPEDMCSLRHLDVIDLSDNKLQALPDGKMGQVQAVELNLNSNQISVLPASLASCPRLKVLRAEENCLTLDAVPREVLTKSQISLLALEGNLFSAKELQEREGYDKYMERFTATKKKFA
ncbi:predicted protein [Nematostella vectensis]|uniref:Leucine-rich repeat-containing protein 57 n=1 Tax=Nematostella vectensis TaxID=45351 RepID=A7SPM2_NEMVE|nr:leucine-rich repeat-containing protein 57 isoform X2 [Nematostella vectensis]EDO34345.1 predicted protein [Nematostella vectensis]|eukprot:XP_001626445.1 predicted protein [Nematostella vectensis]